MNLHRAEITSSMEVFSKSTASSLLLFLFFLASGRDGVVAQSSELTPLQMHASFFDRNKDGVIYPQETYQGLRAVGCSVPVAAAAALFINGFLSPKTKIGTTTSPLLPIYVQNIKKGMHSSDSGAYDSEGRFVEAKFEEIFQKHAKINPNALTSDEVSEMLKSNEVPNDTQGRVAAEAEWKLLYDLGKDEDGFLQKETVRAVFDGSLFYQLEKGTQSSLKNA